MKDCFRLKIFNASFEDCMEVRTVSCRCLNLPTSSVDWKHLNTLDAFALLVHSVLCQHFAIKHDVPVQNRSIASTESFMHMCTLK